MGTVRLNIVKGELKPWITIETALSTASVLIDTGAYSTLYFGDVSSFLLDFPTAKKTDFISRVTGLGGDNKRECPVFVLPLLTLKDSFGNGALKIHNLYIAIYGKTQYGFDMLIGAPIFLSVDYHFINRSKSRYMQIDFDRDIYGYPCKEYDDKGNIKSLKGKIFIKGTVTGIELNNTSLNDIMSYQIEQRVIYYDSSNKPFIRVNNNPFFLAKDNVKKDKNGQYTEINGKRYYLRQSKQNGK